MRAQVRQRGERATGLTGARHLVGRATRLWVVASLVASLAGCDQGVLGMDDERVPLATVRVQLAQGADVSDLARPRVALIWAGQSVAETFCWTALLDSDPKVRAVAEAGCRDPIGFYPRDVGPSVPLQADGTAEIPLYALPAADLMVGDLAARVAYASVVLYDDQDGDQSLPLRWPRFNRSFGAAYDAAEDQRGEGQGQPGGDPGDLPTPERVTATDAEPSRDLVYAASFATMSRPDVRLAFREGGFNTASAFYPRFGCPDPAQGYQLLGAQGFSLLEAVAAFAKGALPQTSGCTATPLDTGVVTLSREATEVLRHVNCTRGNTASSNGAPRYREPNDTAGWLQVATWTCQPVAAMGALGGLLGGIGGGAGQGSGGEQPEDPAPPQQELVVAYGPEACPALRHYVLRGCRSDAGCDQPEWDLSDNPPAWWPCAEPSTP